MRRPRHLLLATAAAVAVLTTVSLRFVLPPSARDHLEGLRRQLRELRASADSCGAALTDEEARFRSYDRELDSLRGRIRAYEALDPLGVPADSYPAYLGVFERYNRGVPRWQAHAETLQAHWRECRAIAEMHNALADSARQLAIEMGLWPQPGTLDTVR